MNIPVGEGWNKEIKWKVVGLYHRSVMTSGSYSLLYRPRRVTTACKGTLGIMCFDTIEEARFFALRMFGRRNRKHNILKVVGNCRGTRPQRLSSYCSEFDLDEFYQDRNADYRNPPPQGTICYPEILVLKEKKGDHGNVDY